MTRFLGTLCLAALGAFIAEPSFADEADMAVGLSDAQPAEIGRSWADSVNDSDAATLTRALDIEALGRRTVKTFTDNQSQGDAFIRGFMRGPLVRYDLGDSGYE